MHCFNYFVLINFQDMYIVSLFVLALVSSSYSEDDHFNVLDFGAVCDGRTDDSKVRQKIMWDSFTMRRFIKHKLTLCKLCFVSPWEVSREIYVFCYYYIKCYLMCVYVKNIFTGIFEGVECCLQGLNPISQSTCSTWWDMFGKPHYVSRPVSRPENYFYGT